MYVHENIARICNYKTIRRMKSNSDTESMVELETAEVTQAGTKGYECEGDVIFAREIHAIIVHIYWNVSRN